MISPSAIIARHRRHGEEMGPWILPGGIIRRTSATRIKLFDANTYGGCERRWWASDSGPGGALYGVEPEPEFGYQATGTETHAGIERYAKTGANVLNEFALSGLHLIPRPGLDLAVEHSISTIEQIDAGTALLRPGGIPLSGKIDMFHRRGHFLDDAGAMLVDPPRTAEEIDWKTTSDIAEYGKTGEELATDIQMMVYAAYLIGIWPDLEWVRLSHVYFQTRSQRRAEKRTVLVPADRVRSRWVEIDGIVRRMRDVAKETDFFKVEPNYGSCFAYTGCPRRTMCPRSTEQVLFGLRVNRDFKKNGGTSMSLVDRLKSQNGQQMPANFGYMPQPQPQFGPPQGQPQSQFGPPQGQPQQFGPPQGQPQQFGPPQGQPQMAPAVQAQVAALEAQEKAALGQAPAYAQAPPPQITPQPYAPSAPQAGAVQYGPCAFCGEMLSNFNAASGGGAGPAIHIACPRRPAQVLPPDAPQSQPRLAANPIQPEVLAQMPQSIQQAAQQFAPQAQMPFGAPQAVAQFGMQQGMQMVQPSPAQGFSSPYPSAPAAQHQPGMQPIPNQFTPPPKGEKCRASRIQIQITPEQAQRREVLCPGGCGQTIGIKPEQIGGIWTAKLKAHHLDAPPQSAPVDKSAAQVTRLSPGLSLYLDVSVGGLQTVDLEQYVANCLANLAQQHGLQPGVDFRQAPDNHPLGQGRWKTALAEIARRFPPDGPCAMTGVGASEAKQAIVEALRPLCKMVVAPK